MPQVLALIPIVLGAVGAGTAIHSLVDQPGAPKAPTPDPAQTAADAQKTKQNQLAALQQQLPNLQAMTGGSLSPEAWAQMAEVLSGQAGTPGIGSAAQDLVSKYLNPSQVTSGTSTGLTYGG